MSIRSFQAFHQVLTGNVPNADNLVQRTGSDALSVRGDGNSRNAILNSEDARANTLLNIPESHGSVATSGRDSATIASKVEGVNVLLVTVEAVADRARLDVPDL